MKLKLGLAALLLAFGTTGCQHIRDFVDQHPVAAEIIVIYATSKYIERDGNERATERAVRVAAYVDTAVALITDNGAQVDLETLRGIIEKALPSDMAEIDRNMAKALIALVFADLSQRFVDGKIEPTRAKTMLAWVDSAASAYAE